jgi:aspartate-semialdehyde dehydrogenase
VHALDILDNVIPFIPKEEEKVQRETAKILGRLDGDRIEALDVAVSATCTRVNVRDGHTLTVNAALGRRASLAEVADALRASGDAADLGPSPPPVHVSPIPPPAARVIGPQRRHDDRVACGRTACSRTA